MIYLFALLLIILMWCVLLLIYVTTPDYNDTKDTFREGKCKKGGLNDPPKTSKPPEPPPAQGTPYDTLVVHISDNKHTFKLNTKQLKKKLIYLNPRRIL